jgi:hypothetical protein
MAAPVVVRNTRQEVPRAPKEEEEEEEEEEA